MSRNTECTIGIENTPVCTKEWTVYTRLHIMLFQGHRDGQTTISWPRSWRRRVCSHCLAFHGDHTRTAVVMRKLQLMPVIRDSPMHTIGDQCQSTKNVMDRDNVDDWLWLWLIEELCSWVGHLPPPIRLSPAGWSEISFRMCTLVQKKDDLYLFCAHWGTLNWLKDF